ncbi:MAG: hypothetical protein KU37_09110 [Sulfuricurvum sp. PC08-66]|nr:MAG: hypothetical protein KU37_09110 [Sulfuricurvum sp. PC08-66]
MLFIMAWRNVWRTRGRTKITMALTVWSMVILSLFISLITGTFDKQYHDTVNLMPGYIQIKEPRYAENPSLEYRIDHVSALIDALPKENLALITTRIEAPFLFSGPANALGAILIGVEPDRERAMTTLHRQIREGRWLEESDQDALVLGATMAQKLGVKLGERVDIVGADIDGGFAAHTLHIVGIFATGVVGYDSYMALTSKTTLDGVLLAHDQATHIIAKPLDIYRSAKVAESLSTHAKPYETLSWEVHQKSMVDAMLLIKVSRELLIAFIIAVIFSVITIFVFLTLYTRHRELGMMRALGTTPLQIVGMVFIERFIVVGLSILIGGVIAIGLILLIRAYPISFGFATDYANSIGFMDLVFVTHFSWAILGQAAFFVVLFSLVSVAWPLWQIARLKPLAAMSST